MVFLVLNILFCLNADIVSVSEPMVVSNPVVGKTNHLSFEFGYGEGEVALVEVLYRQEKIFLGPVPSGLSDSLIVYEHGLDLAGSDLPKKVRTFRTTSTLLDPIPGFSGIREGRRWAMFALGRCVYQVQTNGEMNEAIDVLEGALSRDDNELHHSVIPRVGLEQIIQGDWTKLTRLAVPQVGMVFNLAPADTIVLRLESSLMEITYYPDRIVIEAGPPNEPYKEYTLELRAKGGYWPAAYRRKGGFFDNFRSTEFPVGEQFGYSHRPLPLGMYTLEIRVLKDGLSQSGDQGMLILGPNIGINDFSSKFLSLWPLVPTPENIIKPAEYSSGSYPGGLIFPLWAVKKCMELGQGFVRPDSRNKAKYGDIIDEFYRLEKERKKKPHQDR